MAPPQLPADEALQRRVALVNQSAAAGSAEGQSFAEVQRLAVVEDVAFSIVAGGGTWGLVTEHGASFDGQRLVRVDERLANRQLAGSRSLQVHRDKSPRHGGIAGQEEGLSLLDETGEPVADGVDAQVRSIISDTNDDCGGFVFACRQSKRRDTETITRCAMQIDSTASM